MITDSVNEKLNFQKGRKVLSQRGIELYYKYCLKRYLLAKRELNEAKRNLNFLIPSSKKELDDALFNYQVSRKNKNEAKIQLRKQFKP